MQGTWFNLTKIKLFLLGGLSIGLVLAGISYFRNAKLEEASYRMLNESQGIWYTAPILNYHIVVDVKRPDERRRNEIIVEEGEVIEATVKYWKPGGLGWDTPYSLNEEQAYPFTIPGLYDMVRGALASSNRADIRVEMRGNPPFPHRVVFGPVWEGGRPVMGTESQVTVQTFETIP